MPKELRHPDYWFLGIIISLIIFGVLALASASTAVSYNRLGVTDYYFKHQMIFGLLPGLVLGFAAYLIKLDWLRKYSFFIFLGCLIMMGMVFLPIIGSRFGGAHRWLGIGSFIFQPSEFLKLSFIVYLASLLSGWEEKTRSAKARKKIKDILLPFLVIFAMAAFFLYLQKDLSTLGVILLIAMTMYFTASTPVWHVLMLILGAAALFLLMIRFEPYRMSRILVMLNRHINSMAEGYQLNQALITIGSGGIFGIGLGMSRQRFGFLPESMSDAIFPIFAEETGFIGSFLLLFLFLAFVFKGVKIIKRAPDGFCQLIVMGVVAWIASQAFINIAAMAGILPIAGIPLPFISYGGSALISELTAVGLILNISRRT